ncbi:helicase [Seminavis robusta]|uniref:Helicase n=1 Tax=Seminavis robusta TaxID=568900 RepID=A0A9N8D800_9STRA|nr:helicase [Seminavis robusta]|eukprot:Sro31_g020330.1 helicase (597) ;mRNA; f:94981-96841
MADPKSKGVASQNEHKKIQRRSWEESFQALARYQAENGDCDVPAKYKQDPALGNWVYYQRSHQGSLASNQKSRLTNLGFDFTTQQRKNRKEWRANFERLKVFKSIFGHTRVPQDSPREPMKPWSKLGNWVMNQRSQSKGSTYPQWKRSMLDTIGFEYSVIGSGRKSQAAIKVNKVKKRNNLFTPVNYRGDSSNEQAWYQKYNELVKFRNENGHAVVPRSKGYTELGQWVHHQRSAFNRQQLLPERKRLLDKLGFVWNPLQQAWYERYDRLVNFRNDHGHSAVPYQYKEDPELGKWVSYQRKMFTKQRLPPTRKKLLDKLGFVWDASWVSWDQRLEGVTHFKKVHGHLEIPHGYDNTGLGYWLWDQKQKALNGELATDRVERLLSAGVELGESCRPRIRNCGHDDQYSTEEESLSPLKNLEDRWEENLRKLVAYKEQHGRFPPKKAGGYNPLKRWAREQCRMERNGTLPPHRRAQLESIGFWDHNHNLQSTDGKHPNLPQASTGIQSTFRQKSGDAGPYYPMGARFYKLFPGGRAYQGEIMSFDGSRYRVWYEDGDEDYLRPMELEEFYFILSEDHADRSDAESDDNADNDRKVQSA